MIQRIRIDSTGGPEVLRLEEAEPGQPGPGQALVRHTAIGLNFIDVYFRTGVYNVPTPFTPGQEAAGVVEAVGPGVGDVRPGQRVAYCDGGPGAYSQARVMPADRLVPIPDGVSDEQAAAMMLKGLTAQYLLRQTYKVRPGDPILIHAAAGGVGLIVCQWARHLGATVIGTVGSEQKAELARAHGCDHPVLHGRDLVGKVREVTGGAMLPVVYDSIGKDTFTTSLDCLRPLGLIVCFGQSSGKVPPLDVTLLAQKGSLYLTRPTLGTYAHTREALLAMAEDLFEAVRTGVVRIEINQRFPLAEAAEAHRALEGRRTTGSTILVP
jgi:NADPH:quinone reductase